MQKKNSLGLIVGYVDKFFNTVWMVICKLNLPPLLTVGVIWLALYAFLPEKTYTPTINLIFLVLGCLCLIYALIATTYNVIVYLKTNKGGSKKRRNKTVVLPDEISRTGSAEIPVYYRVAQNPKYIMAEYKDRYELYYEDDGDINFVKTTLKNKEDKDPIND